MLLISSLLVGLVVIMLAADLSYSNRVIEREVSEQAVAITRTISELASERLSNGQLAATAPLAATFVQYGDIERIDITDIMSGEMLSVDRSHFHFGSYPAPEELLALRAKSGMRPADKIVRSDDGLDVTLPLYVNEELRGLVHMHSSNDFPAEKRAEAIHRTLTASVLFLAVVIPLLFLVIRNILKPIKELTRATRLIARGDQVQFSDGIKRADEIGELARSFKRMTLHLARSMHEERRLAYIDPVTGLSNRERMRRALNRITGMKSTQNFQRALIYIDLDGFKQVNDVLGHERGDKLLETVGRRFEAVFASRGFELLQPLDGTRDRESHRRVARIGRLGGDEFLIVGRFNGLSETDSVAAAIVEALSKPFLIDGHQMQVGASLGLARIPEDGADASTLMRNADLAMFEAKQSGGSCFRYYSEEMGQRMLDQLVLELELRRAVGLDEIEPFYMPKVRLSDGALCGVEALARWYHPSKGIIPPDSFIAVAERTGMIADIDRIVMRKALTQAALWHRQGLSVPVAVNVSPVHLERADLVPYIEKLLTDAGLPGYLLELEITETAAMKEGSNVAAGLVSLQEKGVRIAIDDFGTGYSNFAQFHKIPANVIKIDRGLVKSIDDANSSDLLVKTIVALARELRLEIVAEGIDSIGKRDRLAELGCDIGQGFFYSPALPAAKIWDWFRQHSRGERADNSAGSYRLKA